MTAAKVPDTRTLEAPTKVRWWCPDCDRVLLKPSLKVEGKRYHATRCTTAMRQVWVRLPPEQRPARYMEPRPIAGQTTVFDHLSGSVQ